MSPEQELAASERRTERSGPRLPFAVPLSLALGAITYVIFVLGSSATLKPERLNPFAAKGVVTYAVGIVGTKDASCGAAVTITCGTGCDNLTFPYVESAWHHEVEMHAGDAIFANAQILCRGTLNLRVFKDGVIYKETSAVGEYVSVSLEGEF